MPTHSTLLAWKIPWAEEPGGGVMWSKELDAAERARAHTHTHTHTHTHSEETEIQRNFTNPPEVGVLGWTAVRSLGLWE